MKNIYEHHDESMNEWPSELLNMSVDKLLDRLKTYNESDYETIENIIERNMESLIGEDEIKPCGCMKNDTNKEIEELPTFDEINMVDNDDTNASSDRGMLTFNEFIG